MEEILTWHLMCQLVNAAPFNGNDMCAYVHKTKRNTMNQKRNNILVEIVRLSRRDMLWYYVRNCLVILLHIKWSTRVNICNTHAYTTDYCNNNHKHFEWSSGQRLSMVTSASTTIKCVQTCTYSFCNIAYNSKKYNFWWVSFAHWCSVQLIHVSSFKCMFSVCFGMCVCVCVSI